MFKSIKWKIFFGFLVMAFMLLAAGAMSIYQSITFTNITNRVLNNSYNELQNSSLMLESLENEDAGVLLLYSGNREEGTKIIFETDSSFVSLFEEASVINIHIDDSLKSLIQRRYAEYRTAISESLADSLSDHPMSWYSGKIFPAFKNVRSAVKLLTLKNQENILSQTSRLKENSRRAIIPGVIAILAALILSVLFTYFINKFYIDPILVLTRKVEHFTYSDSPFEGEIISHLELNNLNEAIDEFANRYKAKK